MDRIFFYTTPFFFYIISLFWTENLSIGIKLIEKSLSFLIIPTVIYILKPFTTAIQIKTFNQIFIVSCILLVLLTGIFIVFKLSGIIVNNNDYATIINLRNSIEMVPIIGEHPIYFSLIIALGLLLLNYNRFKTKLLNILFLLFLIVGLLIASSKGVITAVMVVSLLLIFQTIKNKKKALIAVVLFFSGVSIITYFSPLKTRVEEITENTYEYPEGIHFNSINLRTAIYNCSFSLIIKSGLFGFAPGDVQQKLNECYKKFKTDAFKEKDYNTHNQYLDYLLSFGSIGFLFILFVFYYYLKMAIKNKNTLYFNFLILFYISFLTENILVRNTGIVLFTIFNSLMAYSILIQQNLKFKTNNE